MGHTWYLQCDMQMFILLPFLIILYFYNKILAIHIYITYFII